MWLWDYFFKGLYFRLSLLLDVIYMSFNLSLLPGWPSEDFYSFSALPEYYTLEAAGVNVAYLVLLQRSVTTGSLYSSNFSVSSSYEEVLSYISSIYSDSSFGADGLDVIRYLDSTDIVGFSEELSKFTRSESFNYCINLSDRYQPKILINMKEQLNIFLRKVGFINDLHTNRFFHKLAEEVRDRPASYDVSSNTYDNVADQAEASYLNSIVSYNQDICIYIILWIRAYRLLDARNRCLENKDYVAFSHRFYGWSQPSYSLNNEFKLEFKTNFGYGQASYFYFVMFYKDIQVFNFMEWVNYSIVEVSEMQKYYRKYSNGNTASDIKKSKEQGAITNDLWLKAMADAEEICNLYVRDENKFVEKHIINNLSNMISELEEIIFKDNSTVNKEYRRYNHEFSNHCFSKNETEKILAMNVKGYMISGVIDFIDNIIKLDSIISVEPYLIRIQEVNRKLLPMLIKELVENHEMKNKLEKSIESNREEMINIWTNGDGNHSLKSLVDLKRKGSLSSDMLELTTKLQEKHNKLSDIGNKLSNDRNNLKNLIRNIDRYNLNIEKKFF